ncbi:hypothetical protein SO802_016732 [Lithocarpus litseifolius]|uniref:GST N-terminal domain-containing protein n=1 Tax=Lithocarpus litseifolius TaxID=425828 RepID=A0AAW2CY02_9ROSI
MASLKLKVSYSCSNNNTTLSSFCKKVVTQIRFPNTTISPPKLQLQALGNARAKVPFSAKIAAGLYISYTCPFAQRVWITRNCKGLQDKIKLVILDRENRPAWYKEKINSADKVPTLEHNNEFKGESLDLIKYIDSHFEGPSLFPHDPEKKEFAEELLSYTDTFNKAVFSSFERDGNEAGAAFDYIETALSKFGDEPFFLGQFSLVDIAYAPFIERFQPFFLDVKKYDIIAGRPKLAAWIKEMDKNDAYKQTRREPKELVEIYKKRFSTLL